MPSPLGRRPAVVFKNTGSKLHTGLVGVEHRADVKGGTVQFGFKGRADFEKFRENIRHVYPLFSSAPFKNLVKQLLGPSAVTKSGTREVVNLSRAQLAELKNGPALAKKIAALKNPAMPAEQAAFISKQVRFVLNTTDPKGRTMFDLLDINSRENSNTPTRDGRINAVDLERFVINTSLFKEIF